jgi:thioredoxin-like negative regulator of GroEL
MMFFKGGCASCAALEPTIDKLAGEYEGRAVVAKLMVLEFTFTYPSPEVHDIHDRYDIGMVPTVRLFVHGQQVKRWDSDYDINHYRQGLNEALGTPAPNPK